MDSSTITLAKQLINRQSVSPNDQGCQDLIIEQLSCTGFHIEKMNFADTTNLWAWHGEQNMPTLLFAGHTDVVPAGDETHWLTPPYQATIKNGILYGRGAADMKGSLAAMVIAATTFVNQHPNHNGRIAFLITSDEEGSAKNGTVKVVNELIKRNERIDYCLVGEPSSHSRLADTIKNGRRGSLNAKLTIYGKQGHVAYPDLADNPIHRALAMLDTLTTIKWDNGNEFFPPTCLQITNIIAGTGADNVIPATLSLLFNIRYSTEVTDSELKQKIESLLDRYQLNYDILWRLSGKPFLTRYGEFTQLISAAIEQITQQKPELSTSGGTSDGRFIAKMGCEVVELGPINATIHQANEHVSVNDLNTLCLIYQRILFTLFIT